MKKSRNPKNFSVGRNFGPPAFFQKKAANEKIPKSKKFFRRPKFWSAGVFSKKGGK
jgi:hypothetical protein